jgi:hypothetical protein
MIVLRITSVSFIRGTILWAYSGVVTSKKMMQLGIIYVVTRNLFHRKRAEKIEDQAIRFIAEEEGFVNAEIPPQNPHDPLPTWKKVKKIAKGF